MLENEQNLVQNAVDNVSIEAAACSSQIVLKDPNVFPVESITPLQSSSTISGNHQPNRRRAGTSVEERPLILCRTEEDTKTCLSSTSVAENPYCKEDACSRPKQREILESSCSSNRDDDLSQEFTSPFASSFYAWKISATSVVDSIREKFSYFRRFRILGSQPNEEKVLCPVPADLKKIGKAKPHDTPIGSIQLLQQPVEKREKLCESDDRTQSYTSSQNAGTPISSHLEDKNKLKSPQFDNGVQENRKDVGFETSHSKNEGYTTKADVNFKDDSNVISEITNLSENTDLRNTETATSPSCTDNRSSLCAPCIVLRNTTADSSVPSKNKPKVFEINAEVQAVVNSSPKIIHQQPGNISLCQKNCQSEMSEGTAEKDINLRETNLSSETSSLLHSSCNSNQLLSCKNESNVILRTSIVDEVNMSKSFNEKSNSPVKEKPIQNKSQEKRSIELWSLRNSLEQSTIEVKFHSPVYGDDDGANCRSISVSTAGGLTEESPMSSPSSEYLMSRGRSMSDSDDETAFNLDRAFIVTPSGRLSPRLPPYYRRRSSGFSSSPEHGFDKQQNTTLSIVPMEQQNKEAPSIQMQHSSCGHSKKVLVTKATIEHPPHHLSESLLLDEDRIKNIPKDSSLGLQKRHDFTASRQWSTLSSTDSNVSEKIICQSHQVSENKKLPMRLSKQMSLPLFIEHQSLTRENSNGEVQDNMTHPIIRFVADEDIDKPNKSQDIKQIGQNKLKTSHREKPDYISLSKSGKYLKKVFLSVDSNSSDDVFYSDDIVTNISSKPTESITNKQFTPAFKRNFKTEILSKSTSQSNQLHHANKRGNNPSTQKPAAFPLAHEDTVPVPPTHHHKQRRKYHTKPTSVNSSDTSSPTSPSGSSSCAPPLRQTRSVDLESDDSVSSQTSSSRSSSSLKSISRLFRRSTKHHRQRSDSAPTFCGYTMNRDYCVDVETDRIFKEFLCQDNPGLISTAPVLPCGELLPPPSHMLPPPPLNRISGTQLRRQVMRKQYSDSIAMYYGQRQRRLRFAKQKSDSVNCPIDRGIFRRQDRIEEEFDPEEINERLSSTSSRRDSERPDFVPPTVNELKEWRSGSEDRTRVLRHTNSLPASAFQKELGSSSTSQSESGVAFKRGQFKEEGSDLTFDFRYDVY